VMPWLQTLWHGLLAFVFYYPLFMSFLWMIGAALFYWRFERADAAGEPPRGSSGGPPVSILIPTYNEGENAEETLSHALALDYPEFEVIAINDGSKDDTGEVLERIAARA
jgi:biofilm PGA synthesis N-glycosyltransferase PgaC